MVITAKAIKYGNDINTDYIIAGKYTKTLDRKELAAHCMEDLDPRFKEKCSAGGGILVAGKYFGCGSSREQAPVALIESGIQCVAAASFSRIFYRSAINIGLPIVECDTSFIHDGDELEYALGGGTLINKTTGVSVKVTPLPELMVKILEAGGMVPFIKEFGGFNLLTDKER